MTDLETYLAEVKAKADSGGWTPNSDLAIKVCRTDVPRLVRIIEELLDHCDYGIDEANKIARGKE